MRFEKGLLSYSVTSRFAYSSIPIGSKAISMSFLSFFSQKHIQGSFQDQRLFEAEVIQENIVFGRGSLYHQIIIF